MGKRYLGSLGHHNTFRWTGFQFKNRSYRNRCGHCDSRFLGSSPKKCIGDKGPSKISKPSVRRVLIFYLETPARAKRGREFPSKFLYVYKNNVEIAAMPDKVIIMMVVHMKKSDNFPLLYVPITFLSWLMCAMKNNIIGATSPFATAA